MTLHHGMILGIISCFTLHFAGAEAGDSRRLFGNALGSAPRLRSPSTPLSARPLPPLSPSTPLSGASSAVAELTKLDEVNAELQSGLAHMQSQIDQMESQGGNATHLNGLNLMGGFAGLAVLALGVRQGLSVVSGRPAMATPRAPSPQMRLEKKVWSFDVDNGVLEAREVNVRRPPPKVLSRLNEIKAATAVADLGLLSKLEEVGAFSKLEEAGAFAFIEKFLPFVDKFKLLAVVDQAVAIDASKLFTAAGFLLVFAPGVVGLTLIGVLPAPDLLLTIPEGAVCGAALAGGVALFPLAWLVSILQAYDPADDLGAPVFPTVNTIK